MPQILFIQGVGEGAYKADARLVEELRRALGPDYEVGYPAMPNEADPNYDEWKQRITHELSPYTPVVLVAHSAGASMLLKCLDETKSDKTDASLAGIFLMAAPFWGGAGWHYEGYQRLELPKDLAAQLPRSVPVFLYHCRDDDSVPYEHLALYAKLLPQAAVRRLNTGGHQFNGVVARVAQDIKALPV